MASIGPAGSQAETENVLVDALEHLLAVAERYPDLRASEQFLELQHQLVNTEDRIQAARRFYNSNVRDYNRRVESVPSNLIAALFKFERREYFQVAPAIRAAGAPSVELD